MGEERIADALIAVSNAIHKLGFNDAATSKGAIEGIGSVMIGNSSDLCTAIGGVSSSLDNIADAINALADAVGSSTE